MAPFRQIGIIGVGHTGGHIARRTFDASETIVGYDRDEQRSSAAYLGYTSRLNLPSFDDLSCVYIFKVANALGYGDRISAKIVRGLGDLAGGILLQDEAATGEGSGT